MTTIDPGNEPNTNPARSSVRDILIRVERYDGHGVAPQEVVKLARWTRQLERFIITRPIGWTTEERKELQELFTDLIR